MIHCQLPIVDFRFVISELQSELESEIAATDFQIGNRQSQIGNVG